MRKRLFAVLLILCLIAITGCRCINKTITRASWPKTQKKATASLSADVRYTLTNSQLEEMNFAGTVTAENNDVSYHKGLESQANYIANQIDMLVSHVQESSSLQIPYRTKVYLCRLDRVPQSYSMKLELEANEFRMPLFVEAGNESSQTIIAQNMSYPYLFIHEIVEMSLMLPKDGGQVLPDLEWTGWFKGEVRNYTRWFREGFANYAGYMAYQMIRSDIDPEIPFSNRKIHQRPFSSLNKVGKELFKWHQYSDEQLGRDYYNAALGLFLVIKDRFGEDAIKEIILEIKKHKYLDGHDLVRITNHVLDTDIEELADSFYFPETGLKMGPLTKATTLNKGYEVTDGLLVTSVEPNSLAERAEIKKDDVILEVDGRTVKDNLDFELAIFERMEEQSCRLLVWRQGRGNVSLDLELMNQPEETASGR